MRYIILNLNTALISFSCLLLATAQAEARTKRALIFDAGSTGTRVYIYEYSFKNPEDFPRVNPPAQPFETPLDPKGDTWNFTVKPGVHSFHDDEARLRAYLDRIMKFVKEKLPDFPENQPKMRMFFNATAGVRSLTEPKQQKLLEGISSYFNDLGLKDRRTAVLTGNQEGIYSWLTINYLLGNLGHGQGGMSTVGVLDMGGYSTQVTFVPLNDQHPSVYRLQMGEHSYSVFTQSFDGFGVNMALSNFSSPPCFNRDLDKDIYPEALKNLKTTPRGHFGKCREKIAERMFRSCQKGEPHCRLKDQEIPKIHGNFFAISGFAFLDRIFRFPRFSAANLDSLGQYLCDLPWDKLAEEYKDRDKPEFLATSCFEMAFYSSFLSGEYKKEGRKESGLGFSSDTEKITPVTKIRNQSVTSWALGAAVYEIMNGSLKEVNLTE